MHKVSHNTERSGGRKEVQAKADRATASPALRGMNYDRGREVVSPGASPVQMKGLGGWLKGLFGGDKDDKDDKDDKRKQEAADKEPERVRDLYFAPQLDEAVRANNKIFSRAQRRLARYAVAEGRSAGSVMMDDSAQFSVAADKVAMPDGDLDVSGWGMLTDYPNFKSASAPRGTEPADRQRYEFYSGTVTAMVTLDVGSTSLSYNVTGSGSVCDLGGDFTDSMNWSWALQR
jgi:hypothetical protein